MRSTCLCCHLVSRAAHWGCSTWTRCWFCPCRAISIMREARSKLRLIKPEDMDMDEYLVLSNSWIPLNSSLASTFFVQDLLYENGSQLKRFYGFYAQSVLFLFHSSGTMITNSSELCLSICLLDWNTTRTRSMFNTPRTEQQVLAKVFCFNSESFLNFLQDAWGADIPDSCVWDQQLPAEERREVCCWSDSHHTLQEEMSHGESYSTLVRLHWSNAWEQPLPRF